LPASSDHHHRHPAHTRFLFAQAAQKARAAERARPTLDAPLATHTAQPAVKLAPQKPPKVRATRCSVAQTSMRRGLYVFLLQVEPRAPSSQTWDSSGMSALLFNR